MSVAFVQPPESAGHVARSGARDADRPPSSSAKNDGPSLIDLLLRRQQETPVETFSRLHDDAGAPLQSRYYRDLIPVSLPEKGQQYAFEVDLDSCTGCKACVAACHNLNGLEEGETWRKVGLLVGGSSRLPVLQHVTTACHHCLEPACMEGCPVLAYEKDPITGIVRHLDDQCIGCQYCILKCPYDVPRYSKSKGIVRKCDMCTNRLSGGEAPACVQACPNQAIRVAIVERETVEEKSHEQLFLPGAPEPGYTKPTTVYKSLKPLPGNLLPADYWTVAPQHSHMPLVWMLVLTQMSAGAFAVEQIQMAQAGVLQTTADSGVHVAHAVAALLIGMSGLMAAIFHLGRPLYAFRAIIGLRTSWLSREILAFNIFAGCASMYTAAACARAIGVELPRTIEQAMGVSAALAGLVGVACSAMIYADTRRPFWELIITGPKFLGTVVLLGLPASMLVSVLATLFSHEHTVHEVMAAEGKTICTWIICVALAKFTFESLIFMSLRQRNPTPLKRTAVLMTGELGLATLARYYFGLIGGLLLPGLLLMENRFAPGGYHPLFIGLTVAVSLAVLFVGEMIERYLFFTAVVAPKMPGAPAS
jgi:Fe-S-cluster-containing dehydrogenase component/DMSO reductase anchor subunit